jgi:23S rRNA (guanine745-N1)-methyltransferase
VHYRCPNCSLPLHDEGGALRCAAGHSFDRAAEGYVNLMVGGRKAGGAAGDSAEMIRARRAFFDLGHYRPVMAAVAGLVGGVERVLDAGCGEGSYLAAIDAPVRHGVDVSKPAVRLAARRHRADSWAVASSYRLPYDDACFDAVVSVFAPRPFAELGRVLRAGGAVVTASPGPGHLAGLRQVLYAEPQPHAERPHTASEGEWAPTERARVRFDLTLGPDAARLLLQMTPYWWSATPSQQESLGGLDTTVDIWVARHEPPSRSTAGST